MKSMDSLDRKNGIGSYLKPVDSLLKEFVCENCLRVFSTQQHACQIGRSQLGRSPFGKPPAKQKLRLGFREIVEAIDARVP